MDCKARQEGIYIECQEKRLAAPQTCYDAEQTAIGSCWNQYNRELALCAGCTGDCPTAPNLDCGSVQTVCVNGTTWECADGSPGCQLPPPGRGCICLWQTWIACDYSPVVIDTKGEGFHLTSADIGVWFTFLPNSPAVKISWTDPQFSNGWLSLDRNGDGMIDDATELFGNITPQPPGPDPNGYAALAVFDDPSNGGNGDGLIDSHDSVYENLRVWIDKNHNGISEPQELFRLHDVGVFRVNLNYRRSDYVDEYGNQFRYKAKVADKAGKEHDMCYDVFLQIAPDAQR